MNREVNGNLGNQVEDGDDEYEQNELLPTLIHRQQSVKSVASYLRTHSQCINQRDSGGHTALHQAVWRGNLEMVQLLMTYAPDLSAENRQGLTPLMLLVVRSLYDQNYRCQIMTALLSADDDECRRCLLHQSSIDKRTILHHLARTRFNKLLEIVLAHLRRLISADELSALIDKLPGYEGPSAIHSAAAGGHIEVLRHLLNAGGNIDVIDEQYRTPLHYAAEGGVANSVEFLLNEAEKYGKSAEQLLRLVDDKQRCPMHTASCCGKLKCLKVMVQCWLSLEKKGPEQSDDTARTVADGAHRRSNVRAELQQKQLLKTELLGEEEHGQTVLAVACVMGHKDVVTWLLSDATVESKLRESLTARDNMGRTPFHLAATYGRIGIVKLLKNKIPAADIETRDHSGATPLITVAQYCPPEAGKNMMKSLLKIGLNKLSTDRKRRTALHAVIKNNQSRVGAELAGVLLESAADAKERKMLCDAQDVNGWTALHLAAKRGHIGVLDVMLHMRVGNADSDPIVNVDSVTNERRNVIHIAAEHGRSRVIRRVLMSVGVSDRIVRLVNKQDARSLTPCHLAASFNHANVLTLLLESGASPDSKDFHRRTPLHHAASRGNVRIAQILLRYAPRLVNAQDLDGNTPLLEACSKGHSNMVRLFLSHGAHFINNKDGDSALCIAAEKQHTQIVRELLNSRKWRSLLNMSTNVALSILKNTPHAMPTLLDRFAVKECEQGAGDDQEDTTVYHLYNLYLYPTEDDTDGKRLTQMLLESKGKARHRSVPRHQSDDLRYATTSPMDRPEFSSVLSVGQDQAAPTAPQLIPTVSIDSMSDDFPDSAGPPPRFSNPAKNMCSYPGASNATDNGNAKLADVLRKRSKKRKERRSVSLDLSPIRGVNAVLSDDDSECYDDVDFGSKTPTSTTPVDTNQELVSGPEAVSFAWGAIPPPVRSPGDTTGRDKANNDWIPPITQLSPNPVPDVPPQEQPRNDTPAATSDRLRNENSADFFPGDLFHSSSLDLSGGGVSTEEDGDQTSAASDVGSLAGINGVDGVDGEGVEETDGRSPSPTSSNATFPFLRILVPPEAASSTVESPDFAVQDDNFNTTPYAALSKHMETETLCYGSAPCLVVDILESPHQELLLHPVIKEWADCKWKGYVRVMNYFYFFVCILFLALLVAFVIVNKQPVEEAVAMPTEVDTCIKPDNSSQVNCSVPVSTRSHLWIHLKSSLSLLHVLILGMSSLLLLSETSQLLRMKTKYFYYASNYLQWAVVVLSIAFVLPLAPRPLPQQWMFGSIAVFLAWINIILCVQWSTPFGIYVAMFYNIMKSGLRAMLLVVLFILAFGFTFYILLSDKEHFSTLSQSMMKTVGMTVGEIDLADTFLTLSTSSDKMATLNTTTSAFIFLKYCVVLLFILILPTLLQNQLIGLAAGEAAEVRRTAVIQIAIYQAQTILEWENSLPERLLSRVAQCPISRKTNRDQRSWRVTIIEALSGISQQEDHNSNGSGDVGDCENVSSLENKVMRLTDLSRSMLSSLEAQQLLLDHQAQRIDRLLRNQRQQMRALKRTNYSRAGTPQDSRQTSIIRANSSMDSMDSGPLSMSPRGSVVSLCDE